jgi:hypothetical protein
LMECLCWMRTVHQHQTLHRAEDFFPSCSRVQVLALEVIHRNSDKLFHQHLLLILKMRMSQREPILEFFLSEVMLLTLKHGKMDLLLPKFNTPTSDHTLDLLINESIGKLHPRHWKGSPHSDKKLVKAECSTHSDFALYNHSIDDYSRFQLFDLTNDYRYINASYKNTLSKDWLLRGGVSYTLLNNDVIIGGSTNNEREEGLHAKVVAEGSVSDYVEIKAGAELIRRVYDDHFDPDTSAAFRMKFTEEITAAFVESDIYANSNFVTRLGARAEYNNMIDALSIDPRISLAYRNSTISQVSLAYGTFRQSAKNEYLRINNSLDPERASHYILNYQILNDKRTFRAEVYYKQYDDLVRFIQGNQYNTNNAGSGYAKGAELFWRDNKSLKNVDYWVSYSYLDTERDYLNFPTKATPSFASQHNFSVVYKHFFQKLKSQVGATYSYTSARPFNDPNEEQFNNGKTPDYHDLSFNWSYLPKSWMIVHVSCTNVLGRDNIFGYEYSNVKNSDGVYNSRPIRQAAPRFFFIGVFITISKDKSMNQLPSL